MQEGGDEIEGVRAGDDALGSKMTGVAQRVANTSDGDEFEGFRADESLYANQDA